MSQTVYYTGTLTEVIPKDGMLLENLMLDLLTDEDKLNLSNGYTIKELFEDRYYEEYVILEDRLYKVKNLHDAEEESVFLITKNNDGSLNFALRYYNGGAGFTECMEEAFDKINY